MVNKDTQEKDKTNFLNIMKFDKKIAIQFYDKIDNFIIEQLQQDFYDHKDKYEGYDIYFISREKIKDLLKKGIEYEKLIKGVDNEEKRKNRRR